MMTLTIKVTTVLGLMVLASSIIHKKYYILFVYLTHYAMVVRANYCILKEGLLMLCNRTLRFIPQRRLFTWMKLDHTISHYDRECITLAAKNRLWKSYNILLPNLVRHLYSFIETAYLFPFTVGFMGHHCGIVVR